MLLKELKQRNGIILSENENDIYIIYPSNKEEVETLTQYKIDNLHDKCDYLEVLDMCGHISEVQNTHVKDIIKEIKVHKEQHFSDNGRTTFKLYPEYRCYQENKNKSASNNVICHEDKVSSFKCVCERIQSGYFIVVKLKRERSQSDILNGVVKFPLEYLTENATKEVENPEQYEWKLNGNNSDNNNS